MKTYAKESSTRTTPWVGAAALLAAALAAAPPGHAGEGELIILREVPYRPAVRESTPAPPLAVKVSPEFNASVITGAMRGLASRVSTSAILTDVEAATISANAPLQSVGAGVIAFGEQLTGAIINESRVLGARGAGLGVMSAVQGLGARLPLQVGVAGTAVRRATGGLGDAIRRATAPR